MGLFDKIIKIISAGNKQDNSSLAEIFSEELTEEQRGKIETLRGPGATEWLLNIAFDWEKISREFLSKIEGYLLPEDICHRVLIRRRIDHFSGLVTTVITEYRRNLDNFKTYETFDDDLRMNIETGKVKQNARGSWEFNELKLLFFGGSLDIGFLLSFTVEELDSNKVLDSYPIGRALRELGKMERMYRGSSQEIGFDNRAPASTRAQDNYTCEYDRENNPDRGQHRFIGKYSNVSLHYRTYAGIFTEIEEYHKSMKEDFEKIYLKLPPPPKELEVCSELVKELRSFEVVVPAGYSKGKIKPEQIEICRKRVLEWERNKPKVTQAIENLLKIKSQLGGELGIAFAKYAYLEKIGHELARRLEYSRVEIIGDFKFSRTVVKDPKGVLLEFARRTRFTLKEVQHWNHVTKKVSKGDFISYFEVSSEGSTVFAAEIPMESGEFGDSPVLGSLFSMDSIGKITKFVDGKWLVDLLELRFVTLNDLESSKLAEMLPS